MTVIAIEKTNRAKQIPQYLATLSVCIGALGVGTALGWTGNISEDMKTYSFNGVEINDYALGWIGSIAMLGSVFSCIPCAILCDMVGRKLSLLLFTIPSLVGWLLLIFPKSLWMIYSGRFLTGVGNAAFAICAPIYISEIAEKQIRGALSSYIDLHLSIGILVANVVALVLNMQWYTAVMGLIPVLFAVTFVLQPESPVYYATKNRDDDAKKALRSIRGKYYNVIDELDSIKLDINCEKFDKKSIIASLKKKGTQKSIFICFCLKFFQQAVGINAVYSYTASIFESTDIALDVKISTIIVGLIQLISTYAATTLVDKVGRKILLIASNFGSALSIGSLGLFFTLKDRNILDEDIISKISFLPVICVCIYMITFSIGLGPMPVVLTAELLPAEIKSVVLGLASIINFLVAFLIIKFYFSFEVALGTDGTFYTYAVICLISTGFSYYFVPETKGKSFAQIQTELNK